MVSSASCFSFLLCSVVISVAQESSFSPCPLLGPRFPIPKTTASSPIVQEGGQNLTAALDAYLAAADGEFGPITPNTTSFSILLFSVDDSNSTEPYFYEYHHTAPTLKNSTQGAKSVDSDSIYRVGDLTQLFTTYLFLIEAGEEYWDEPVSKWVPELSVNSSISISNPRWDEITLGDLAAHLGGTGNYNPTSEIDPNVSALLSQYRNDTSSSCETGAEECGREEFLSYFGHHSPVFNTASTPIFSNAGYIILAAALETITGRNFTELLNEAIISPLGLSSTSFLPPRSANRSVIPSTSSLSQFDSPIPILAPLNGLYSTPSDIAITLRSILSHKLLPAVPTRRWLKPISFTSNRANSVGRPWEVFSLIPSSGASPVIPVFQVRGNVGLYSSHVGIVPDYSVGFAILTADSEASPDLNAYADIIAVALIPAFEKNAIMQASLAFSGTYRSNETNTQSQLTIAPATDSTPGLALTNFESGDIDILAVYAELNKMQPENMSARLYPTDLVEKSGRGEKRVFRALFQDVTALADAGTPACDTWRGVDGIQIGGVGIDEFIFMIGEEGQAVSVEARALGLRMVK